MERPGDPVSMCVDTLGDPLILTPKVGHGDLFPGIVPTFKFSTSTRRVARFVMERPRDPVSMCVDTLGDPLTLTPKSRSL